MSALDFISRKKLMPTHLGSAELMKLDVDVRNQSLFSARTLYEDYLGQIKSSVESMLNPVDVVREDGVTVARGQDLATARLEAKQLLGKLGYAPDAGEAGGLTDLSSDARINLVLKTNTQMAQGYGQFIQGQDEAILDMWPAQELFRAEDRKEPRDWLLRWQAAGGRLFDGRMIALKDDQIWTEISAFGNPFPPFDFNSGMDVRDIDREEAEQLGLLTRDQRVEPQAVPYPVQDAA